MHEMQTVVLDDPGVCLSICLSVMQLHMFFAVQTAAEWVKVLLGVYSILGGVPDLPL